MNGANYKTIIVLDHGPFFATSCGEVIDIESRSKQGEAVSVSKSLWTSSVEVALEYLRIVNDLFPDSRFIRYIVSDFVGRFLTAAWSHKLQNLENVLESFAQVGAPDAESDPDACVILSGLSLAVEGLTQVTEAQKIGKKMGHSVMSSGRIVVFTHLKQDEEIETIETHVSEQIASRNKLAENLDDNFLPLDFVELCLVNIYPLGTTPGPTLINRSPKKVCVDVDLVNELWNGMNVLKVSESLWTEFRNCSAGKPLASCIQALVLQHYNLASTTVTGIPMKEEQTSGSSVNYDVDLLHEKSGHAELTRAHYLDKETGLLSETGAEYKTLMLKWCSPNLKPAINVDQFHMTTNAVRVSPASVNSRPSACLTAFILGGRTVMLEIPKKAASSGGSSQSSRLISHLLVGHGGHIYIHSVALGKSPLEDPPSVSEGPGGRVTDYRITMFGDLMRECALGPGRTEDGGVEGAKNHLRKLTAFWPMTMSESFVFSCQRFEPLLTRMRLSHLNDQDLAMCKQVVLGLLNAESLNEPLLGSAAHCPKVKGLKRDEQYRLAWHELELYIRNYSHVSSSHFSVLNCLLQCQGKPPQTFSKEQPSEPKTQYTISEVTIEEEDKGFVVVDSKSVKDSPVSPGFEPPSKRQKPNFQSLVDTEPRPVEKINLLQFWLDSYEKDKWKNWKDFDRRAEASSNKVELYPDLALKKEQNEAAIKA